jgi:ubiquitin-protein ligase
MVSALRSLLAEYYSHLPELHGVLSVREGLYRGLHAFTVTLPPLYPAHEPHLSLACVVPHPLVSSEGRVSTTSPCSSLRACLEHLRAVMHVTDLTALCRTSLAPVVNAAAYDL